MDTLYTAGKTALFKYGWTPKITWARLYTDTDDLVDEQSVTFIESSGIISPSADIVFSVAASTNDVSYIKLGYTTGLDFEIYRKDLDQLYDFTTAGSLTVDTFTFTIAGTYLTVQGKSDIWTQGFEEITFAKLYTSSDVLVDTQTTSFTTNTGTGALNCDADIIFDVAGGTNNVYYIQLGYNDGSDKFDYKRLLSTTYNFTTTGTLKVDSWAFTVS